MLRYTPVMGRIAATLLLSYSVACAAPLAPPPAGQEASYEWYVAQCPDPVIFTAIGPPADPAETGVSPRGQLMMGKLEYSEFDGVISGTPYVENSLAFGLVDNGRFVTVGSGKAAKQSLVSGSMPIVITEWEHDGLQVRETAFARPLRGDGYVTGMEATLAWAVFEITPTGKESREISFAAAQIGTEKSPRQNLSYRDGVVFDGETALFTAKAPAEFRLEFQPLLSPSGDAIPADALEALRLGGIPNVLVARGRCEAGKKTTIAFCRVFQFPGTRHWSASPVVVAPRELTQRSPEEDLQKAEAEWAAMSKGVSRFTTPDAVLNRIVARAMLDGYFLTKRWQQRRIVFDSVCYRCQWDDTSAKWFYALDLMGDHATATELLDTVFYRQGKRKPKGAQSSDGCFSDVTNIVRDGSDASWASANGWALWSMAQHARLTGDRQWLSAHKKQILDGCAWVVRERRVSKEVPGNPCDGLIFGKFVCDLPDEGGVKGVGYFTYTDAISYMGLRDIASLLRDWGHVEGDGLCDEAELYRKDILAAVDRLTDRSQDPWFVPWALGAPKVDDPYLGTLCGPINLAYAGVVPAGDQRIDHVIRWNIDRTFQGSLEASAMKGMFYSQEIACVLLERDRVEDFLRMFYTVLASNVTHETLSTCEWRRNTQPDAHSIASMVRMFRTMMIQEREGSLLLLQGTPRCWLEQGKEIQIREAPTEFGPLSLHCASRLQEGQVRVRLTPPPQLGAACIRLRLRLPQECRIAEVVVDGQASRRVEGEWIELRDVKGPLDLTVKTEAQARSNPR